MAVFHILFTGVYNLKTPPIVYYTPYKQYFINRITKDIRFLFFFIKRTD